MAAIRGIDQISKKWATVTPQRAGEYLSGVQDPRADWRTTTVAANQAWKDGIAAAVTRNAFEKGVSKAGSAKWQAGAVSKGAQRYGPGVQLAESAYAAGFGPYASALKALTLPPRFARRDARNGARVGAVNDTMIKTKLAQLGA